jgi:tricorn protease interacting factor F2/3
MEIKSYEIELDVDFQSLGYKGRENINLENSDGTLVLDTIGHEFARIAVDGKTLPSESVSQDSGTLTLKGLPKGGSASVSIDFSGKVDDKSIHGFYKSSYDSGYLLATDFEPTGARRLFPCVDNPSFRAEIILEVLVDESLTAISNMPIARTETLADGEGRRRKRVIFEKTPKMSTYLLFLGIGKFEEEKLDDGGVANAIEIIGAASPGKGVKTRFGLENGAKFLKAYTDYYSIPYPLKKLHLIALPEYAAGAMENWGAITFREAALLIDENSSVSNRRRVTSIIGHEVAHQWFGDLVTMKWWNDLWLNESFATFMEAKTTDSLYPDWKMFDDFLLYDTGPALGGDSLRNTHPIDVNVSSPEEVSSIFDEISYGKGASILRMIEAYLGEESFRSGVARYLERFKYANAEGNDLWRSIQETSGQPVERIMSAWIKTEGHPVVDVERNGDNLELRQRRFLLLAEPELEGRGTLWPIPLTANINGKTKRLLMDQERASIVIEQGGELRSLKFNVGQTGFYRVHYSKDLYDVIKQGFDRFGDADRYGILNDLFSFMLAGSVEPSLYFEFARRVLGERSYIVANEISGQLGLLFNLARESEEVRRTYGEFLHTQIDRLGTTAREGESDHEKLLREGIARDLALFDDDFAEKIAANFGKYRTLDPGMRNATAVAYARVSGERGFDDIARLAKEIGNDSDEVRLLRALTTFRDGALVERALDLAMGGELNRANSIYAVNAAAWNQYTRDVTWRWFIRNLDQLREMFAGTSHAGYMAENIIPGTGIGREKEVSEYFSDPEKVPKDSERGIKKGMELLEIYSRMRTRLLGG